MRKLTDYSGLRFGTLTVKKRVENTKDNKTQWLCECDCGNTVIKPSYFFTSKSADTASCPTCKSAIGHIIGDFIVTGREGNKYVCKCRTCSIIRKVRTDALKSAVGHCAHNANTHTTDGDVAMCTVHSSYTDITFKFDKELQPEITKHPWFILSQERPYIVTSGNVRASTIIKKLLGMSGDVLHINGDMYDFTVSNLREVTYTQFTHNRKVYSTNTTGVRGVYYSRGRWTASITVNNETIYLGSFSSKEDAAKARKDAEVAYGCSV